MTTWAVRVNGKNPPTGFDDAALALEAYDEMVKRARDSGRGGLFELLKDGVVVGSSSIPPNGDPQP